MSNGIRLTADVTDIEGIPVVQVHGEIDLYTVSEFDKALKKGMERQSSALIVDLSDISYIDSAGLSTLLAAFKRLSERNAMLYVVAPPSHPGVYRVLDITRINTVICVRPSVESILRDLRLPQAA